MATFNFSIATPEEGATFIFGSWIYVANGQGGFHSHLVDATEPETNLLGVSGNATELAEDLSRIQLSDLLGGPSLGDQERFQSETFFDPGKASDDLLITDATNPWEAPVTDELLDNEPISIIGKHLDLTIASTPQGRFVYWKGMEHPELLGHDARLVAYFPNLPYQDGNQLSPIHEEGARSTEIVTDHSDESYTDRCVYVADVGGGHRENELPEVVSADDLTANAGNEDDTQRDARRAKNHEHEQWREDARQR